MVNPEGLAQFLTLSIFQFCWSWHWGSDIFWKVGGNTRKGGVDFEIGRLDTLWLDHSPNEYNSLL